MLNFLFKKKKTPLLSDSFILFLKNKLGVCPVDQKIYLEALTHSSYKNIQNKNLDNERLEFLGDAFISLSVANYLYKLYPEKQEGYLTQLRSKIVSRENLNKMGSKIGLEEFIFYQKGSNNFKSLIGNAFEAIYGAIFFDLGYVTAQKSIEEYILKPYLNIDQLIVENRDYKSELLIFHQKNDSEIKFKTVKDIGTSKEIQFVSNVLNETKIIGKGKGSSKKIAEQNASKDALKIPEI